MYEIAVDAWGLLPPCVGLSIPICMSRDLGLSCFGAPSGRAGRGSATDMLLVFATMNTRSTTQLRVGTPRGRRADYSNGADSPASGEGAPGLTSPVGARLDFLLALTGVDRHLWMSMMAALAVRMWGHEMTTTSVISVTSEPQGRSVCRAIPARRRRHIPGDEHQAARVAGDRWSRRCSRRWL